MFFNLFKSTKEHPLAHLIKINQDIFAKTINVDKIINEIEHDVCSKKFIHQFLLALCLQYSGQSIFNKSFLEKLEHIKKHQDSFPQEIIDLLNNLRELNLIISNRHVSILKHSVKGECYKDRFHINRLLEAGLNLDSVKYQDYTILNKNEDECFYSIYIVSKISNYQYVFPINRYSYTTDTQEYLTLTVDKFIRTFKENQNSNYIFRIIDIVNKEFYKVTARQLEHFQTKLENPYPISNLSILTQINLMKLLNNSDVELHKAMAIINGY
jgi:hypothetical protein